MMSSVWSRSLLVGRIAGAVLLASWAVLIGAQNSQRPAIGALIGAVATSFLAAQPRFPLTALTLAFGGLVALEPLAGFEPPEDPFIVAILWASYGVGRYAPLKRQPWAAVATLFFLSINLTDPEAGSFPATLVFPALFTAAPWLLGLALQLHASRSERARELALDLIGARESELRRATTDERLRLARELHDVAAHHMTAVSIEAQVLRARLERGEAVVSAQLASIESTAQQALDELRKVLGVLRVDGDAIELSPQPSVLQLPELVDECHKAGQPVEFAVEGIPRPISDGISLAAYRIAQEALTNARRHGADGTTTLALRWQPKTIGLMVHNPTSSKRAGINAGNGVRGMQERAELYGGSLAAGPDGHGGWVVEACIPAPEP